MKTTHSATALSFFLAIGTAVLGAQAQGTPLDEVARITSSPLSTSKSVKWTACGDNFDCSNITVPLDHKNASDKRTYTLAVTRFKATDKNKRYVNVVFGFPDIENVTY
jgi:hypothetical protein